MVDFDYGKVAAACMAADVLAVGLFGSHARGDFGPFSDVDIVRLRRADATPVAPTTQLVDGHFVVVSDVTLTATEDWFNCPKAATENIGGLRAAKPLIDPQGHLASLIRRALAFEWTRTMQRAAAGAAGELMVGWIEEAQKALEGLRRSDLGRMLNGKHGLTWGMLEVMRVKRGVLLTGENGALEEVLQAVGRGSEWSRLCLAAFGVGERTTLEEELVAGLRLYLLTAQMLRADLLREHRVLIDEAATRIGERLAVR